MLFIKNLQESFGLDIGDLALRLVALKKKGRYFNITAYGERLLPPGLSSEGKILKIDELAATIVDLTKKPDWGRLNLENAVTCLPDTRTFIKLIGIPWPKNNDLTNLITLEAQKHIPLDLKDAYLDWQVIAAQENAWLKIILGITPKEIVDDYVKLLKLVGLSPTIFEVEAAAISRALILGGELPPKEGLMILDLGATRSGIIIYAANTIQFSITIPLSGVQLTQAVALKHKISYAQAEEIKIKSGISDAAIKETIAPLLEKIKETIEFYQLNFPQAPACQKILLTGGGSNMAGLGRLIQNTLNLPVEIANPFTNIKGQLPQKHAFSYATAIGLAMRGCQPEKFYDFA